MLSLLCVFIACESFILDDHWIEDGPNTFTHNYNNDGGSFVHTGSGMFDVQSQARYNVNIGQIYYFKTQILATGSTDGTIYFSYRGHDANNKQYYETPYVLFTDRSGNFIEYEIPFYISNPNIINIVPRISGRGHVDFKYKIVTITKGPTFDFDPTVSDQIIETDKIKFTFYKDNFRFDIYDKLSKRTHYQADPYMWQYFTPSIKRQGNSINITVMKKTTFHITYIAFTVSNNEVRIELQQDYDKEIEYQYPTYMMTQSTDQLIIPHGEGMIIPVNQNLGLHLYMSGATGHGVAMQFFAAARYENNMNGKEGYVCIIETPDDSSVTMQKENQCEFDVQYVYWHNQKGNVFGYNRIVKYVIFNDRGHVSAALAYKEFVTNIGRRVTFLQKAEKNPSLLETYKKLQGAPNIWMWTDYQRVYNEMKNTFKWTNLLASETDGSFVEWAKSNGIVPSRYDIYQDAIDPALKSQFDWNRDWVDDAYANDELVLNEDGSRRKGWGVYPKNGGEMQYAGVVSDKFWPKYLRKKIDNEMKNGIKRLARFIDTATASEWYEDYHPSHPSNKTLSKHQRYATLDVLHNEYGLVVGSETGHDSAVGACDYFEGMMSLPQFRTNDPGRNMEKVVMNPEERVVKYQVGERYRLPLWELVYHDCVIAYWYWGDYNNKMPTLWHKRDLFNALYAVPPMYFITSENWDSIKSQVNESYYIATESSKYTMFAEMIDHKILKEDWSVQQCIFSNGVKSSVNFGSTDFTMSDGFILKSGTSRVEIPESLKPKQPPTQIPTKSLTKSPSISPSQSPTKSQTRSPTKSPSRSPSKSSAHSTNPRSNIPTKSSEANTPARTKMDNPKATTKSMNPTDTVLTLDDSANADKGTNDKDNEDSSSNLKKVLIVAISVGSVFVVICVISITLIIKKRKSSIEDTSNDGDEPGNRTALTEYLV